MRWKTSLVLWIAPGVALASRGSVQLVDGQGLAWFFNDNIALPTTSSASGAASEARFTGAVAATTVAGGLNSSTLYDLFDGYNSVSVRAPGGPDVLYSNVGRATIEGADDCAGRVVSYPQQHFALLPVEDTAGLGALVSVWRSVYVPADDDYARWVTFVRNDSADPAMVEVTQWNNLGSDSETQIVSTSSGDTIATPDDAWVTSWQNRAPTSTDPRLGVLLRGPGAAPLTALAFHDGDDNPRFTWTLSLAPGETGAVASFAVGETSKALAEARVRQLYASPEEQSRCMSAADWSYVQNFNPCPTPDACTRWAPDLVTGACVALPQNEGGTCDDGLACTQDDVCGAGICMGMPGQELCNGLDDDCDDRVDDADDSVQGQVAWFADLDGDSFGAPGVSLLACEQPADHVADALDCDDADGTTFPGATEVCGGGDDDCDGAADDSDTSVDPASLLVWYADVDHDGWGTDTTALACSSVDASRSGDCDDLDAATHPGATEVCGGGDDDCDGLEDLADSSIDAATTIAWYADLDGDLQGAGAATYSCTVLPQSARNANDCDDANASIFLGGTERCDAADIDEDCDGVADDADAAPEGRSMYFIDLDADGFGAGDARLACDARYGERPVSGDCDDDTNAAHPGGSEVCDGLDNDCDGLADDADRDVDPRGFSQFYLDSDEDGFGDFAASTLSCVAGEGYLTNADDCDDTLAAVSPTQAEVCDGVDNDCDGAIDDDDRDLDRATATAWYADLDGDGVGQGPPRAACAAPPNTSAIPGDCDDLDASASPLVPELCGGGDEDCDGLADDFDPEGADGVIAWWGDADGDGFGAGRSALRCAGAADEVSRDGDCDDADAAVAPSAEERCDDVDQDCDGVADDGAVDATDWFVDADGDGFGAGAATAACAQPVGSAATAGDCADADPTVGPGATEVCNGVDDDCDGLLDSPPGATAPGELCGPADTDIVDTDPVDTDIDTDGTETVPPAEDTDSGRPIAVDDTDTTNGPSGSGCGCASAPASSAPWASSITLGLVLLRRRRAVPARR